jgi:hypothetical protein
MTIVEATSYEISFDRPWSEEVVDSDTLRIDRSYQRDVKTSLVNEIGQRFDLALAGFIVVSRRSDGTLYVIDGQQRVMGARKAGEKELLARVFAGLMIEEEAEMYDALNETKPLSAPEKFKGAHRAGRPDAVAIYNIVHSFGASIMGIDGYNMNSIAAISALRRVFSQGGEWGLTTTLSIIRRAFGEISRQTCPSSLVKSVYMTVSRHPGIDESRLARRLGETGLLALKQRAIAFATRNADASSYYVAILDAYNHKLREEKRLNPVFRRTSHLGPEDDA